MSECQFAILITLLQFHFAPTSWKQMRKPKKSVKAVVWGVVCKNIISDRFSTKTAISGRDSYLCQR